MLPCARVSHSTAGRFSSNKTCETVKTQLASSNEAFVKTNAKYKDVKKEKLALHWFQTCREFIELVEKLQAEAKADPTRAWTDPVDEKTRGPGNAFSEAGPRIGYQSLDACFSDDEDQVRTRYPRGSDSFYLRQGAKSVFKKNSDTESLSYPFLCLTLEFGKGRFVLYGPTHQYNHSRRIWTEGGFDLEGMYGTFRELFAPWKR
ncbi:hypothetical protein C8R47DRAFT_658810 [Mycena vitilis]|nr:hypothetical protein C8R47DRAFT_658810 [Mycena vitilis]